jgi:L-asparaginase
VQNLVNALRIAAGDQAGIETVPEVCLYFRDHLLRGCRATKRSANGFDAFESPNYPPLGVVDQKITIFSPRVRTPDRRPLTVRTQLDPGVVVLRVTPGLDPTMVDCLLGHEHVHGVVLQSFGAGNVPINGGLVKVVGAAVRRGVTVLNVTQCLQGRVEEGLYQGSARLREVGVISGGDMTTEAAVIKLQIVLAEHKGNRREISRAILSNWAGERSSA